MTKVIGFDLDDTIVPEVLFIRSGIRHIAGVLHTRMPELPAIRIQNRMDAAAANRLNHYSALEDLLQEYRLMERVDMKALVAEFRSHMPDSDIYHPAPSMVEALQMLRAASDIRTVLITDGRSLTQRNKIQAAGLHTYFDDEDIFISEEFGYDKKSPEAFLRVMEKYAGADEYHFVGDNPQKDFLHPDRLGWTTHLAHPFPLMVHQGMPR